MIQQHNTQTSYSSRFFKATDITPRDDTFHTPTNLINIEWWYFDAVFENDISIHIGIRIYHIAKIGLVQSRINVYEKGTLLKETLHIDLTSSIHIDEQYPTIQLNNNTIVSFNKEKYQKDMRYQYRVTHHIDDVSVDLLFDATTKGWKIETPSTNWAVPLPHASVSGTITIQNKEMSVSGTGYHDHNWGYAPTTVMKNLGWYWGRLTGETLNVTWAKLIETEQKYDLLAILNKDYSKNSLKESYQNIHPRFITFHASDFKKQNNHVIPTIFDLSFTMKKQHKDYASNIHMETQDVHFDRIFIIYYWRYHVISNGFIQYGKTEETIKNKPQIIEFLSFKKPRKQWLN